LRQQSPRHSQSLSCTWHSPNRGHRNPRKCHCVLRRCAPQAAPPPGSWAEPLHTNPLAPARTIFKGLCNASLIVSFTMKTFIVLAVALSCVAAIVHAQISVASFSDANCQNLVGTIQMSSNCISDGGGDRGSRIQTCSGNSGTIRQWNNVRDCSGPPDATGPIPVVFGQCTATQGGSFRYSCNSGSSVSLALLSATVAMLSICL
jgi:hypothetical protein